MQKKRWGSLLVALGIVMAVGLAACGKGEQTSGGNGSAGTSAKAETKEEQAAVTEAASQEDAAEEAADETPVEQTLRVMWWGNQDRADSTAEMIHLFEEKHPGVTVEFEFTDWGGYWDKLSTLAISGNLPDVLQMDVGYLVQYATSGLLADLQPYITSGALDMSGVPQSVIDCGEVDGAIRALPTGSSAPALAYRPDVAEEAGVEVPMEMTRSQYLDLCREVYAKTGWKTSFYPSVDFLDYSLRNYGLHFFNEDGSALGFDDPSYIVKIWQCKLDGMEEGYNIKPEDVTSESTDIYAKDTWIDPLWSNQLGTYETDSGCELKLVNLVQEDDATEPSNYLRPTMYWSVAEGSENADLAVEFINFFVNDTDVYDIVGIDRGIPIDAEAKAYIGDKLEGAAAKNNEFVAWLSEGDRLGDPIIDQSPKAAEVRDKFGEVTQKVVYRVETDLEQAAKDFMEEANAILASAAE